MHDMPPRPRLRQVALRPEVLLIIGSAKLERDKMINLAWAWVIARLHSVRRENLVLQLSKARPLDYHRSHHVPATIRASRPSHTRRDAHHK
jgi:hypothetical protein